MELEDLIKKLENIKLNPRTNIGAEEYNQLAVDLANNGREDLLAETLELAIEREKTDHNVFYNLGAYYYTYENHEKGIEIWKKARELQQTRSDTFYSLGMHYHNMECIEKALEIWEEARNKQQTNPDIFYNLGRVYYFNLQNPDKAAEIWEEAKEKGQMNPEIYDILGVYYSKSYQDDKAISLLEEAIEKGQADARIFHLLATCYQEKGNFTKTIFCIDKIAEIAEQEEDYRVYVYLADYFKLFSLVRSSIYKNPQDCLKQMIKQMRKDNKFESTLEDYKKATSKIKIFGSDPLLSQTLIVKESKKPFDAEKETRDKLKKIVGSDALLPDYIDHFEHQGNFYYIMEREEGHTLTDLITESSVPKGIYNQILKLMAKIHVLMPIDDLVDYDFIQKSQEKVLKAELNSNLIESLEPVLKVLVNSTNWSYNKDSCTDNWLIVDGKILICDTEDRGIIPYAVDLAHFLNFIPSGTFDDNIQRVLKYIGYANEVCKENALVDKKINDVDLFITEYCNGVVYRAVSNCSYLFSKKRPTHTKQVLQKGIEMIDYMESNSMIQTKDLHHYNHIKQELQIRLN